MYVATYSGKSILEFAAGSNGNVPPMRTIAGPHTLLENPIAVAVDRDGTIYAADYGAHALLVFSAQASGDAPPSNVIHMAQPTAVTISERR